MVQNGFHFLHLQEPIAVSSHVVTISSLLPATAYNCSVTSFSHDSPSVPTFIAVSTMGNCTDEGNPVFGGFYIFYAVSS